MLQRRVSKFAYSTIQLIVQIILPTIIQVLLLAVVWATLRLSDTIKKELDSTIPMGPYVTINHLGACINSHAARYFKENKEYVDEYLTSDSLDALWEIFRISSDLDSNDFSFLFELAADEQKENQPKEFEALLDDANEVARITGSTIGSFITPLNAGYSKIILVMIVINSIAIGSTIKLPKIRLPIRERSEELDSTALTQPGTQNSLPKDYPVQYKYVLSRYLSSINRETESDKAGTVVYINDVSVRKYTELLEKLKDATDNDIYSTLYSRPLIKNLKYFANLEELNKDNADKLLESLLLNEHSHTSSEKISLDRRDLNSFKDTCAGVQGWVISANTWAGDKRGRTLKRIIVDPESYYYNGSHDSAVKKVVENYILENFYSIYFEEPAEVGVFKIDPVDDICFFGEYIIFDLKIAVKYHFDFNYIEIIFGDSLIRKLIQPFIDISELVKQDRIDQFKKNLSKKL